MVGRVCSGRVRAVGASLKAPVPFGPYLLLERIGAGGMAEVWRAAPGEGSPQTQFSTLALKKILPNVAENPEFRRMFVEEALITTKLAHPNIAQVTDFGEADGALFMAMEYVAGKDLHPMNVMHRDVSLNNILVSYEGAVKLIDFGIARAASKAGSGKSARLSGNVRYMSPELASGKKADARSDLFAMGSCLYALTVGEQPFEADNHFGMIEKIRHEPVTAPSVLNPDFPEELEEILLRALEKDVDKRFESAADMQSALDGFATGSGFTAGRAELASFIRSLFPDDFEKEVTRIAEEESEDVLELDDALPPEPTTRSGRTV